MALPPHPHRCHSPTATPAPSMHSPSGLSSPPHSACHHLCPPRRHPRDPHSPAPVAQDKCHAIPELQPTETLLCFESGPLRVSFPCNHLSTYLAPVPRAAPSAPPVALPPLAAPRSKNSPPPPLTLPPCRTTMLHPVDMAKTHEILARFRPIAPRPAHPPPPLADEPPLPPPHGTLQLCSQRPCRSRKRGRSQLGNSSSKRQRTLFPLLPAVVPFPAKPASDLLTLTLLPRSPEPDAPAPPVEQDLLRKLQEPRVIAPQPVRPVGSSISVVLISPHAGGSPPPTQKRRRPEEVEEEVEGDALPAVVSDSRNRVRLANSAYREMVGQPECRWLDAMGMRPRRIGGEVMLDVGEARVPEAAAGFSCRARIEWACDGRKRCVSAPCSVVRLFCDSKDYAFAWRFDTSKTCRHCTA